MGGGWDTQSLVRGQWWSVVLNLAGPRWWREADGWGSRARRSGVCAGWPWRARERQGAPIVQRSRAAGRGAAGGEREERARMVRIRGGPPCSLCRTPGRWERRAIAGGPTGYKSDRGGGKRSSTPIPSWPVPWVPGVVALWGSVKHSQPGRGPYIRVEARERCMSVSVTAGRV